jgi:hypothetical protein
MQSGVRYGWDAYQPAGADGGSSRQNCVPKGTPSMSWADGPGSSSGQHGCYSGTPFDRDAVGSNVPVGGRFRRGTDIVKALAFGARSVLVPRPALWGLAAYGSDGVETDFASVARRNGSHDGQLLQSQLGRAGPQFGPSRSALGRIPDAF